MYKVIKIVAISLLLLLLGCTNDLFTEQTVNERPTQKEDKVGAAIDFLNEMFVDKEIEGAASGSAVAPKTVNLSKASIDTIYHLPDENNKPFLQLVVFKPKAYAVVSVIKNVPNPPVLFYSQGKFDVKKPDIGLVTYLQEFYFNAGRDGRAPMGNDDKNKDGAWDDGRDTNGTNNPRDSPYFYKETIIQRWNQTTVVSPLLKTSWHQGSPYSNTVTNRLGSGHVVGCVPVAIGQVVAYHRKNKLKAYNWNLILKNDNLSIKSSGGAADLLWDIGQAINAKYNKGGLTSSNITNPAHYFRNAGYKISGYFNWFNLNYEADDFKVDDVIKEINNKRPVYLRAAYKRTYNGFLGRIWSIFSGSKFSYEGHAWVADGYKIINRYVKIKVDRGNLNGGISYRTGHLKTVKMLHMNWGWKYTKNSWCTYDYWHGGGLYFKWNKKMIKVKP